MQQTRQKHSKILKQIMETTVPMHTAVEENHRILAAAHVSFASIEDAEEMFVIAKERMIEVNDWQKHVEGAELSLVNGRNERLHRPAHQHDHLLFNDRSRCYITHIRYDDFPDEQREKFAIIMGKTPEEFPDATLDFMVQRSRDRVEVQITQSGGGCSIGDIAWQQLCQYILR